MRNITDQNVMNNLFTHIEYLLLRHDCMIVPGFGAFILTHTSAEIDIEAGKIVPPVTSLMFNQAVNADDGLLANSLVRQFGISFEDARMIISKEVANIKRILQIDKSMDAGRLGSFHLGEEGNLMFSPSEEYSNSHISTGYLPVDLIRNRMPSVPDNTIQDSDTSPSKKDMHHMGISRTAMKIAAMIAIVLSFAIAVVLNPIPYDDREQRASVVPVDVIIRAQPEETVPDEISSNTAECHIENTVPDSVACHYLIVATFKSGKEADRYVKTNSSDEYPLFAVASKNMTRVAIAKSSDRDDLRKKLNTREIASRFPNSWIWTEN